MNVRISKVLYVLDDYGRMSFAVEGDSLIGPGTPVQAVPIDVRAGLLAWLTSGGAPEPPVEQA